MLISQLTPKVRWDSTHPLPTRHLSTPSGVTDHWIHLLERLTSISNKNGQNRTLDFPLQKRWTGQKRKRLVLARNFLSLSLESHVEGRDSGGGGKKLIGRCRNRTRFTETLSVLKRDSWEEILWGSGKMKISTVSPGAVSPMTLHNRPGNVAAPTCTGSPRGRIVFCIHSFGFQPIFTHFQVWFLCSPPDCTLGCLLIIESLFLICSLD